MQGDTEGPQRSDEELLRLLATDLDAHFELFYDKYEKSLYRLAYSMLLGGKGFDSNDEAADSVQQTMIKAYFALKRFSQERILALKPQAWLKTIVIHEVQHRLKQRSRVDVESQLITDDGKGVFENIQMDLGLTPETLTERAEIIEQIEKEIQSLPLQYQKVVKLFYIDDWKEKDIARITNIPLSTIKTHVRRARLLLQTKLKPLWEDH